MIRTQPALQEKQSVYLVPFDEVGDFWKAFGLKADLIKIERLPTAFQITLTDYEVLAVQYTSSVSSCSSLSSHSSAAFEM